MYPVSLQMNKFSMTSQAMHFGIGRGTGAVNGNGVPNAAAIQQTIAGIEAALSRAQTDLTALQALATAFPAGHPDRPDDQALQALRDSIAAMQASITDLKHQL